MLYLPLGFGYVGVAGAEDFFGFGDAAAAVGKGEYCLRAADLINAVDAAQPRGVEDFVGYRRRAAQGDAAATGDFGGHGEH